MLLPSQILSAKNTVRNWNDLKNWDLRELLLVWFLLRFFEQRIGYKRLRLASIYNNWNLSGTRVYTTSINDF